MYKIKIYTVGKSKESWLNAGLEEYTKRLKTEMTIEWILAKNSLSLDEYLQKESYYLALDPQGLSFSSEAFSALMLKEFIKGGSRIVFVIGGAEGLSKAAKSRAKFLISLSPLTFTHQLTRLVLIEQLYRALEIEKGSSYHK